MNLLLLIPSGTFAGSGLALPEFVITAEKFQWILWQEFLIEFPNIYSKASHKIFKTGTVVFYDSDQSPALLFFANQKIQKRADGSVSRITRLNMRSPSGKAFLDILVNDVGKDLKKTPLTQLLMGKLPLDLDESALQEKNITISGEKVGDVEIKFSIRSGKAGEVDIAVHVVSKNRNLYRIKEIQRNDSREVTWFLDHEESFKGHHTLRVKKVKTDWMLLGSEEFYVDGLERTPARYQSDFAGFGVQDALVSFQKLVKEDIRSAMCPDCAENSLFAGDDK